MNNPEKNHISFEQYFFMFVTLFGIVTWIKNIVMFFTTMGGDKLLHREYMTLLVEMPLGILLMFVPYFTKRFLKLILPQPLRLYYWFFIWIAVFLGTGMRLIVYIPFWDKILHASSPILLVALGYGILASLLMGVTETKINPWLYLIFGFSFGMMTGVLWEFWEFLCDQFLQLNLQRYQTQAGVDFVGRAALMDTMGDLFTNTFGAILMTVVSYFASRKNDNYFLNFAVKRLEKTL